MQEGVSEATRTEVEQLMDEMERIEGNEPAYGLLAQKIVAGLASHDLPLARTAIARLRAPHQFEPALKVYAHTGSEEDRVLCERSLKHIPREDFEEAQRALEVHTLCWKGEIEAAVRLVDEADDAVLSLSLMEEIEDHAQKDPALSKRFDDAMRDHVPAIPEDPDGAFELDARLSEALQNPSPRMRAKRSIERLARLMELNAPPAVVRNEAFLLLELGQFAAARQGLLFAREPFPYGDEVVGHIALGLIHKGHIEKGKVLLRRLTDPLLRAEILLMLLLQRLRATRTFAS